MKLGVWDYKHGCFIPTGYELVGSAHVHVFGPSVSAQEINPMTYLL